MKRTYFAHTELPNSYATHFPIVTVIDHKVISFTCRLQLPVSLQHMISTFVSITVTVMTFSLRHATSTASPDL